MAFDMTALTKAAGKAAEQDEAKDVGLARKQEKPQPSRSASVMDRYGGPEPTEPGGPENYGQRDIVQEDTIGRGPESGPVTEATFAAPTEFAQKRQVMAQKARAALPQAEDFAQESVEDILAGLGG